MNIILWILFGGIAGWLAAALVGASLGVLGNVVVGILGALFGGWISEKLNIQKDGSSRPTNVIDFVWAVIGAVILIILTNLIF